MDKMPAEAIELSEKQRTFLKELKTLDERIDQILNVTRPVLASVFKGLTEIKGNPEITELLQSFLQLKEKVSGDACTREIGDNPQLSASYQVVAQKMQGKELPPIVQLYYSLQEKRYL
ncbi:hypothetical protein J4480_03030 [Candidatus Woesearchaeota archaeon]|nr:hypothetical protein [Candidatus Woesearchaeota archaeon]